MELLIFELLVQNCLKVTVAAIFILLASLLLPRLYQTFRAQRLYSQIPGPNAAFIIRFLFQIATKGTTNIEIRNMWIGLSRIFSKYGLHRVQFGHLRCMIVCTPELAEILLTREEILDRPPQTRLLAPQAIGNNLFTASPVQEWRRRRKLLNPAFHIRIIEQYLPVFNKQAAIFVEKMKQLGPKQPIDLLRIMQSFTMDIILETAMGVNVESGKKTNLEFLNAFQTVTKIGVQRLSQPWLYPDIVFKCLPIGRRSQKNMDIVKQLTRKIIAEKKSRMLTDPTTKKQIEENFVESAKQMQVSFVDLLLYHHLHGEKRLTEEDILAEITALIFAGFDTTSVALSWALFFIGNDSRVQQAIHNELDTVLDNDRDRPLSAADIKNVKYLKCVFKETLRLCPPASILIRQLQTKDLPLNGFTIPEGTTCSVLIEAIHKDPRYFPKPERFIPERFLNNEGRHPFAYIPFAGGPKNCLGQRFAHFEAMTLMASLLRNFCVKSATTRDKVRMAVNITTMPIDPLQVYLTSR